MRQFAWVWLGLFACGPVGKLAGTVSVTFGSPSAAVVTVLGEATRSTTVGEDGSWEVSGLPDGTYQVEVVAPSTIEGRVSVSARVTAGAGTAPPLMLTGAGAVSGRVVVPGGPLGAEVFVAGLPFSEHLGADGAFQFSLIPAGAQTVVAAMDGFQPLATTITVEAGSSVDLGTLVLVEDALGTGAVRGSAVRFDAPSQGGVQVSAVGLGLSTLTAADGTWSLSGLPPGAVQLTFAAPGYGTVTVDSVPVMLGAPHSVPEVRLFRTTQLFAGRVYGDQLYFSPDAADALFVGIAQDDPASAWLYDVDWTDGGTARALARLDRPSLLSVAWDPTGGRAVFQPLISEQGSLWAVDLDAGAAALVTNQLRFGDPASDFAVQNGRAFFVESAPGPTLAMYDFASHAVTPLEPVEVPAQIGTCAWPQWAPGSWPDVARYFQVSADGRVAYQTSAESSTPHEVHVFDGASATKVWGELACFRFRGGGTVLVGVQPGGPVRTLTGPNPGLIAPGTSGAVAAGFTGDDQFIWVEAPIASTWAIEATPISGGGPITVYTGGTASEVIPQPNGQQLAIYDAQQSRKVWVTSATGAILQSFTPSQLGAGTVATAFYSASGRHLLLSYNTDDHWLLMDAASQQVLQLPGLVPNASPWALQWLDVRFSPADAVVAWTGWMNGAPLNQLWRNGALTSSADAAVPAVDWVSFAAGDQAALLRNDTGDVLVDLASGAEHSLGLRAYGVFTGSSALFNGDGSRLVYADLSFGPARLFAANPETGAVVYAHDLDGSPVLAVPGRPELLVVEDPTRVDPSTLVQPPGLYVLTPP